MSLRAKGHIGPSRGPPVPAPAGWWDEVYRTSEVTDLPWYTPVLDTDFERAVTTHLPQGGRILDLGTGPATQAIALAKRGYDVVATDISPSAITKARHAARREGVRLDLRVDNLLESALEDALADAILDRGMFHTLPPDARPRYVSEVHRILRPRGFVFLKVFSDQEPRWGGPYRFSAAELRSTFEATFEVLSIEDARFHVAQGAPPRSLLGIFRRR